MAKKKGNLYGVSNYHKRTPKKRPGRIRKKMGPGQKRPKKIEARDVDKHQIISYNKIRKEIYEKSYNRSNKH